jgi:hypothetical protein
MSHDMSNPPPPLALLQMMMGAWVTQAVGTFARLRMADYLAEGPTAASIVAERAGTNPDATHRLMRALTMVGVLAETAPRTYALTPVGQLLRSDVPGSMRALLDAETAPGHWLPWGRLDECVRTGISSTRAALGADVWTYYAQHLEEERAFSEGMSGMSAMELSAVGAVYQPPEAQLVVDVGGAHGAFLAHVLKALPKARGVLMDLPTVVAKAGPALAAAGIQDRVETVAGDFFSEVPAGGDLYLLKHIVHDWDDEHCRKVLGEIRRAIKPEGKLLVVEMVLPEDGSPSPAILLDLNMMVMLPGRERTVSEFTTLLKSTGFEITRVVRTQSPAVVFEARPV